MAGSAPTALFARLNDFRIWVRLVIGIVAAVALMWAGFLYWAGKEQRQLAEDQARDFALSVHQMTMAGLTGMMITNTVGQRDVFLDQIKQSNHVEELRVYRSSAVIRQFGIGKSGEVPSDPEEIRVLESGEPLFRIVHRTRDGVTRERLKTILPAIAVENYLGRNCISCHQVPIGTILGAVSMEISLDRAEESVSTFTRDAMLVALGLMIPLGFFVWYFIARIVTRPLRQMTAGLDDVARGEIGDSRALPREGNDEIGQATQAFNRVLDKAQDLLRTQRLSRIVFENALEGITITDAKSRIQMVNKAFTDTTGYTLEEVAGQTPAVLKSGRMPDEFYAEFWGALREKGEWRGEIWNKRKNGTIYPEWLNVSAVRNARGEVEHYIAIFSDITERKQREELITFQAFHDALTGLPNRTLFRDRLERTLAGARRHKYRMPAVMFLDLDRFKQINDTLGHDAGDELLKEVASRLKRCVRESDTVARIGGDEFTILLPEIASEDDARAVGDKILELMKQPITLAGKDLVITTSVGVALYPRDGRDPENLMKAADTAMYHVKGAGRAAMAFFAPELVGKPSRRNELETRLVGALKNGEFVIHYQPIVDLPSGRTLGVEALLRWRDADGTLLLPEDFIGIAEDLDLMREIGQWVLREACIRTQGWRADGHDLFVAVNVSPRQFHRAEIIRIVTDALAASQLPARCLQLEISETLAMRDIDFATRTLASMHSLGIRLAIDDYGIGYLNFSQLTHLSLDFVKLDRSLVRDALSSPKNRSIASALVKSAATLGLEVIAEGIETEAQRDFLRDLGCAQAQGHLFCRAADVDVIGDFLDGDLRSLGHS
jgi:diguanylate cyclase (GGDEF)-like protein/PAS domain S-box-containing protein